MSVDELNPNHPVLNAVRGKWPWLFAILMRKQGRKTVRITSADLIAFSNAGLSIAVRGNADDIEIFLVDAAQGEALAREAGGLPV